MRPVGMTDLECWERLGRVGYGGDPNVARGVGEKWVLVRRWAVLGAGAIRTWPEGVEGMSGVRSRAVLVCGLEAFRWLTGLEDEIWVLVVLRVPLAPRARPLLLCAVFTACRGASELW